jgi:hypothetical protein
MPREIAPFTTDIEIENFDELLDGASLVVSALEACSKDGTSPFSRLLATKGEQIHEWDHLPPKDCYDPDTRSQYFYHVHKKEERIAGEHGHLHIFRGSDLPSIIPVDEIGESAHRPKKRNLTHLFALALDSKGAPIAVFTTNHFVCGDNWLSGEDTASLLEGFHIGVGEPDPLINSWVNGLVKIAKPWARALLLRRDSEFQKRINKEAPYSIYKDRSFEIPTSSYFNFAEVMEFLGERSLKQRHFEV